MSVASMVASLLSTVIRIGEASTFVRLSLFDAWMMAAMLSLSLFRK